MKHPFAISLWEQMAIATSMPNAGVLVAHVKMRQDLTLAVVWGPSPGLLHFDPDEQIGEKHLARGETHTLPFELAKKIALAGHAERVDREGNPYIPEEEDHYG